MKSLFVIAVIFGALSSLSLASVEESKPNHAALESILKKNSFRNDIDPCVCQANGRAYAAAVVAYLDDNCKPIIFELAHTIAHGFTAEQRAQLTDSVEEFHGFTLYSANSIADNVCVSDLKGETFVHDLQMLAALRFANTLAACGGENEDQMRIISEYSKKYTDCFVPVWAACFPKPVEGEIAKDEF